MCKWLKDFERMKVKQRDYLFVLSQAPPRSYRETVEKELLKVEARIQEYKYRISSIGGSEGRILTLKYIDEYPDHEIGKKLKLAESSVKTKLRNIRRRYAAEENEIERKAKEIKWDDERW